jgi:RHS repeat-associated protein
MKTKLTLTLLAFAAVSVNLRAATSALPAPLPELMNDEQAAKWTADQEAQAPQASSEQEPSTQFYTGKPYVADAGGYIFKYRTYNPEMARWTTADPSGFPDGVNNRVYASMPLSGVDPDGLSNINITYSTSSNTASKTSSSVVTFGSGSNNDYSSVASITATPSASPMPGSGTIAIDGTTELVSTGTNKSDTAASSSVNVTLSVSTNSSGDISVSGIPSAPQTNSGGTNPNILDNTLTIAVTGNGTEDVTISVTDAATGTGTVSGGNISVPMTITLE